MRCFCSVSGSVLERGFALPNEHGEASRQRAAESEKQRKQQHRNLLGEHTTTAPEGAARRGAEKDRRAVLRPEAGAPVVFRWRRCGTERAR